jgi:DNA-binding MarR family transcriptional regulator
MSGAPLRQNPPQSVPPALPEKDRARPRFDQRPGYLIRRCQQIAVAIFMDEAGAFDVTPVQYAALSALRDNPGIDATRLSQVIAFDRSTLGSVLDRLEGKAWIERHPKPDDRRVKLLYITAAGGALLDQIIDGVDRSQDRILGPLDQEERTAFLRMLVKLVEANNSLSRAPAAEAEK